MGRYDGWDLASLSSVHRAMARRGLLRPVRYQAERRQLADCAADFIDEYNTVRPDEALAWRRPLDTYLTDPTLKPKPRTSEQDSGHGVSGLGILRHSKEV